MEKEAGKRRERPALVVAAVSALILLPLLLYPYGRDQAVFADVAATILAGGMPYRDVWEIKPPGVYLIYAAVTALFGPAMAVIRAVDLLVQAVTAAGLYRIGRTFVGRRAAAIGALWYAALYLHRGYWSTAQAESFAGLLALGALALCLLARREPVSARWLVAGVLAGCAALLKYPLLLPCLVGLAVNPSARLRHRVVPTALVSLGAALPILAACAWLVAGGAWDAYVEIQREFVAPYARIVHGEALWWGRAAGGAWRFVAANGLPCLLAALGSVIVLRGQRSRFGGLLFLWLGLAAAAVAVQGKYFGYHWVPMLLPLALLAGVGTAWIAERASVAKRVLAPALVLSWALAIEGAAYLDSARVVTGVLPYSRYLERFGTPGDGDYSFLENTWAAGHARATTRPEEGLFVWGFETGVYQLSERRPPTRFHFAVPLVSPWAPERWRHELIRDLEARPPALIMVLRNDAIPWASGRADDSTEQLDHFPELAFFLARRYRFERRIEDFTVFRRKIVK